MGIIKQFYSKLENDFLLVNFDNFLLQSYVTYFKWFSISSFSHSQYSKIT